MRLKSWLYQKRQFLPIVAVALVFFVLTAGSIYLGQKGGPIKWLSPDETANYVFSKLYSETGDFLIFEKNNLYVSDLIAPRSFRSDFGWLKPVSFIGLPFVYGSVAKVFGQGVIPYLTPFLAAIGLIFFYLLIKEIFKKNNLAFLSTLFLAFFPVYIYYTVRSLFHNIPFIVFLIIGLYFLLLAFKASKWPKKIIFPALSGLFLGLGLITRTSEIIWVAPLLVLLALSNIRKITWFKFLIFLSFFWLALLPLAYFNQSLYGSVFKGGYNEINRSLETISAAQNLPAVAASLQKTVFYFGLNPTMSLKMFYHYGFSMFPALFVGAFLGLFWFLKNLRKEPGRYSVYLAGFLITATILLLYYGSWKFNDNPDPRRFTIGNSYTRYWLPVYLGALPFLSLALIGLTNLLKKRLLIIVIRTAVVLAIITSSLFFVFNGSEEGLYQTYLSSQAERKRIAIALPLTEPSAVIITRYHDKWFFPERKVIVGLLNDDNLLISYRRLLDFLPVYYYNFSFSEKDFNYLNNSKLIKFGFNLREIKKIEPNFSLYKLEKK